MAMSIAREDVHFPSPLFISYSNTFTCSLTTLSYSLSYSFSHSPALSLSHSLTAFSFSVRSSLLRLPLSSEEAFLAKSTPSTPAIGMERLLEGRLTSSQELIS